MRSVAVVGAAVAWIAVIAVGAFFALRYLASALNSADYAKAMPPLVAAAMTAATAVVVVLLTLHATRWSESAKIRSANRSKYWENSQAAALAYYRALEPLATGNFDFNIIEGAEAKMLDAEAGVRLLSKRYCRAWYELWQFYRKNKEEVHELIHERDARIAHWASIAVKLRDLQSDLERMMAR